MTCVVVLIYFSFWNKNGHSLSELSTVETRAVRNWEIFKLMVYKYNNFLLLIISLGKKKTLLPSYLFYEINNLKVVYFYIPNGHSCCHLNQFSFSCIFLGKETSNRYYLLPILYGFILTLESFFNIGCEILSYSITFEKGEIIICIKSCITFQQITWEGGVSAG